MSDFILLKAQNALRDLIRDDWTLGRMEFWKIEFVQEPNGKDALLAWQSSVDFIYRCLTARLVKVLSYDHYGNTSTLMEDLRRCNPYERGEGFRPGDYAWRGIFSCGTDELEVIVDQFFQNDDEYATNINSGFILAIKKVFADAGVPWTDEPLVPIISTPV